MVFRETNAGVGQTAKLVSWVLIELWLIDDGYSNLKKRAEKLNVSNTCYYELRSTTHFLEVAMDG